MEGDERGSRRGQPVRHQHRRALEHDPSLIERQAVETRPVLRREGFEPVQRPLLLERGGIALEREGRVEDAGAAAIRFLPLDRMRRAVGAEEEFGRARGRRPPHRPPVLLPLRDRQAVEMRPQPAREQGVAVDVEVLRSHRRRDVRAGRLDEGHRLGGGDMLEHDLELRENRRPAAESIRSMNTASRSKMSTSGSVTSPWTSSGIPTRCIASSAGWMVRDVGDAIAPNWSWHGPDRAWPPTQTPRSKPRGDLGRIGVVGQIAGHQRLEARPRRAARIRSR